MVRQKMERVGTIKEFIRGEFTCKKTVIKRDTLCTAATVAGGSIFLTLTGVDFAHASAVSGAVYDKITNAFMPLVELVKGLSYPIALVIMSGGALMIMIGNKEKGYTMIQNSAIGYILVQMMPLLMDLLVELAKAL
ncbi:hypothetical protein T260_15190 [Geobacillus thermopakistaniensis]|uniref:Uncharacterized protein n=1 Tax=Geobacillus thermopakistaniensis (strain MAS1) TaxID=1408282 RepID=A0A7U9J8Y3_GEOTM|nr:hypothetical protein [Geobacillus sp. MAS1]ESU71119.1 hypothetical protein T260_15190 [Geobacillus sp. MAS1]